MLPEFDTINAAAEQCGINLLPSIEQKRRQAIFGERDRVVKRQTNGSPSAPHFAWRKRSKRPTPHEVRQSPLRARPLDSDRPTPVIVFKRVPGQLKAEIDSAVASMRSDREQALAERDAWGGTATAEQATAWAAKYSHVYFPGTGGYPLRNINIIPFPQATAPIVPRYLFETVSDLRKLPVAKCLIEGWLPEQGVGLVYGEYGHGKSFLLFDWLLHLAYGLPDWHGCKLPGEPRDVLLIAREGASGFRARVDAFKAHRGIKDDTDRLMFMRSPANLGDSNQFDELKLAIASTGRRFAVVAVDTVGRAMPGEDFNDAKSVTAFMERLQQLGEVGGGVAIGAHHENKSGDLFGSVYYGASSDFMFRIERDGGINEPLTRGRITCTKMKDGEDGWRRRIDYTKAADSMVIADVTESMGMIGEAKPKRKLTPHDKLAFQALEEALKAHGKLRPEMPGRTVTFDEWMEQCHQVGAVKPDAAKPRRDLHDRQVKLQAEGIIAVGGEGGGLVRIIYGTTMAENAAPIGQNLPTPPLPQR